MIEQEMIERITEAYDVFRRLPDPERRFLKQKMASWPVFVRDAEEIAAMEKPRVTLTVPSAAAIDRAWEVLGWFATHLRDHPIGAKVLWMQYGRGLTLSQVAIALRRGARRGFSRTNLRRQRDAAMAVLLSVATFIGQPDRTSSMDGSSVHRGAKRP